VSDKPLFHLLAGPNGAGKSTLYCNEIEPRFPHTEFVNADLLAQALYGHPAVTREESETGQRLAEQRRRELMAARKDLATESTFSHPSKIDLVREAKAAGYEVRLYHVNVRSPDLAVKRVERRVRQGGHPVPEHKTRERYERNQPLIHAAAKIADRAYVFDNSEFGKPHRRVLEMVNGNAVHVSHHMPPWARQLYADELRGYAPERLNRASASFAAAQKMAQARGGPEMRTMIARSGPGKASTYTGEIIAETDLHIVQAIGRDTAIAHFKSRLDHVPAVGNPCSIAYTNGRAAVRQWQAKQDADIEATPRQAHQAKEPPANEQVALAWLKDPEAAAKRWPASAKNMHIAQTLLLKAGQALREGGMTPASVDLTLEALRQRLARDIADGKPIKPRVQDKGFER